MPRGRSPELLPRVHACARCNPASPHLCVPPAGVTFLTSKVSGVSHGGGASTVSLTDGRTIQGTMVLDATGHARKLVNYDKKFDPGYQGAYGITAGEVGGHA